MVGAGFEELSGGGVGDEAGPGGVGVGGDALGEPVWDGSVAGEVAGSLRRPMRVSRST